MSDFNPSACYLSSQLKNGVNTRNDILELCKFHSIELKLPSSIDPVNFMLALSGVETSFGRNNVPRFELGYSKSSLAYKRSDILKEGYETWGDLCAQSYGPWQVLWVVARQYGYHPDANPLELTHGVVSAPYVVEHLNNFAKYQAKTLEDYYAAYNGGPGVLLNKKNWPTNYVKKAVGIYNDLTENK